MTSALTGGWDGGASGGVTVSVAVRLTPAKVAAIVTTVGSVTRAVPRPKPALVAPAGTVTLGSNRTAPLSLVKSTAVPPGGDGLLKVTLALTERPPTTLAVLIVSEDSSDWVGHSAAAVLAASDATVVPDVSWC